MWLNLERDIRYAVRGLLRTPTFTATVVTTLAIGIGLNSVVFSAANAVLWRDAPVSDPGTLVEVFTTSGNTRHSQSSYPDYFDLRDSETFASLAAFTPLRLTLDAMGRTEPAAGLLVSGNYFEVLGVKVAIGRELTPGDDRIAAPVRVAVMSHALWRRAFNGDRTLIGQTLRINGNAYTLVGVAPPGFGGTILGVATDLWLPTALQPEVDPPSATVRRARGHAAIFDLRRSRGLSMVGRLPAGARIDHIAARADVIGRRLAASYPDTNQNRTFVIASLGEGARGLRAGTRPTLRLLGAVVFMVLVVACVNVATLLLARAVSRERELAVRIAIGASRADLTRQWLVEAAVLGTFSSLCALLVARVGTPLLHRFVIPDAVSLTVNVRVLGFTLAVGIGSALVFGFAPIVLALRRNTIAALRAEGGTIATGARAASLRGAFVVSQIAISLVLIVGAGLFLRTLKNAYAVDVGYQIDQILVVPLNLEARGYFEGGPQGAEAGLALYEQILSRVEALPGVVAASAARMTVLSGGARSIAVSADGRVIERDNRNAIGVRANVVSHRYFETMNIPILRGRAFEASDRVDRMRVAIVSTSLAHQLWPNQDPIGKIVRDESAQQQMVVGIVPDTVSTSTLDNKPQTYFLPLAQNYESGVALHVRTAGSPMALAPAIREVVAQADPTLPAERAQRLRDVLDRTLSRQRMMATLVGLFGGLALILAAFGLYGVMAHAASQRTAEIGIRLAIGGRPASIFALLLREGIRLLGIGIAIGLAVALLGVRYVEAQLFGVAATDPLTFVGGCLVLMMAGVLASLVPALRAMRVDPVVALRHH